MVRKIVLSALFAKLFVIISAPTLVIAKEANPISSNKPSINLNKISTEAAALDYDSAMQAYTKEIQSSQITKKPINNNEIASFEAPKTIKANISNARYGKLSTSIEQNSKPSNSAMGKTTIKQAVKTEIAKLVPAKKEVIEPFKAKKESIVNTFAVKTPEKQVLKPVTQAIESTSNANLSYAEIQLARELGIKVNEKTSEVRPDDVADFQKIGSPYQVNGIWYIPAHEPNYREIGKASWYGDKFHGKKTANGEIFDMNQVSVAHPTLPLSSLVQVTNLDNGRSIVARVNDRGPFIDNRLIDVSKRGAELLGFKDKGHANVRITYVGQAEPIRKPIPKPLPTTILVQNKPIITERPIILANTKPVTKPIEIQKEAKTVLISNSSPKYTYQIGAFSNKANAERALKNMANGNGMIVTTENNGTIIHRVMTLKPVNTEAASTI